MKTKTGCVPIVFAGLLVIGGVSTVSTVLTGHPAEPTITASADPQGGWTAPPVPACVPDPYAACAPATVQGGWNHGGLHAHLPGGGGINLPGHSPFHISRFFGRW